MQIGEAVVSGASQGPKGAQEVEFKAVCSMANCERLNVIAGEWRAAVTLDRPPRGTLCQFKVTVPAHLQLRLGDNVVVEFFYPGEQAGAHVTGVTAFNSYSLTPRVKITNRRIVSYNS